MKKIRAIVTLLLLVGVLGSLSACGKQEPQVSDATSPTQPSPTGGDKPQLPVQLTSEPLVLTSGSTVGMKKPNRLASDSGAEFIQKEFTFNTTPQFRKRLWVGGLTQSLLKCRVAAANTLTFKLEKVVNGGDREVLLEHRLANEFDASAFDALVEGEGSYVLTVLINNAKRCSQVNLEFSINLTQ